MLNTKPLVSVIIGCYNHQEYVAEAIDSVMKQTYSNFELIISDDGSTDLSRKVIKEKIKYWNNDSRITFLESETNTSFAVLENAFKIAKGKYICGMGGDDKIFPQKIEKQVMFLENNSEKYKACFTWVECLSEKVEKKQFYTDTFNRVFNSSKELLKEMILVGNCLCAPSFMMNRETFVEKGGYDFSYLQLQDYRLWLKYLSNNEIYVLPEKLTFYRVVDGSLSNSGDIGVIIRDLNERLEILVDLFQEISEPIFDLVFPDEDKEHHSFLDLKCREIKTLIEYSDKNSILADVAIRLYYKYNSVDGFCYLLKERYGIDRKKIYQFITDKSSYSTCLNNQKKLIVYKTLFDKRRFEIDNINKADSEMVEELLDIVDTRKGTITLDHIISLYEFCKNNETDDFAGLIREIDEKNIKIIN